MTNDEEPIELLMPSAAMQPVLSDLRAALVRLGDVKTRSAPRVWDNIDFESTAANIARFTLWTEGWDEGVIPAGDVNAASDIGHRLSAELEIMSPDDLEERFRVIVDGAPVTRLYRRISDAQTVSRLMKDTMALGWSGFDMLALSPAEQETMRRRRMFVDAFRNDFDWTRLRALELSQGAALLEAALYVEMVQPADIERLSRRIAGEAIARCASWTAFARALLCARTFCSLRGRGAQHPKQDRGGRGEAHGAPLGPLAGRLAAHCILIRFFTSLQGYSIPSRAFL